jgi:hypothetical protein
VVVSGDDVAPHVHYGRLVAEGDRQVENARLAVEALPDADALLFLPADSPLLTGEMLRAFHEVVAARVKPEADRWFAAGLTGANEFRKEFPRMATTTINLKDGAFVSGALYAASRKGFFHALSVIEAMSESRKNQVAMLLKLGPGTVVRYLMHRISIADAEERLGRLFEGQAIIVTGCDPRSAADIDDVASYDEIKIYANLAEREQ